MTKPPVTIRSATRDDTASIHAIYAPYVEETTVSFEEFPPTIEEMAKRIEATVPIRLSPTPTICRVWRRVAREADEAGMDVPQREDLSFPRSLPEFQRLFPDDAACAAYLEKARWGDGFVCTHCQTAAEPFRFTSRPGPIQEKWRRPTPFALLLPRI